MGRGIRVAVAGARRVGTVGQAFDDSGAEGVDDRFELGEFDALALAGAVPVAEGGHHRGHGVAGVDDVVGVVGADAERRAVGEAGHLADTGDRGEHGAKAQEIAMRPFHTLHGGVGGDDARVHFRYLVVVQVPLVDDARCEVREEDVALLDEAVADLLALFGVEVELEREFSGVEVVEVARDVVAALEGAVFVHGEGVDAAECIDLRLRFDADDFGAVGGEGVAGDGAGSEPGEVGNADAFERSFGHGWSSYARAPSTAAVCSPRRGGRLMMAGDSESR